MTITLAEADRVIAAVLSASSDSAEPISVVVLDSGGTPKAFKKQDGGFLFDFELAFGRAFAALSLSPATSEQLAAFRDRAPGFRVLVESVVTASHGRIAVEPGGVRISGADKTALGAVGVSGPAPAECHANALAGTKAAGFDVA